MDNLSLLNNNTKRVCIIDDDGTKYSYKEINIRINNLKKFFKKKNLILIISSFSKDFIINYLSFLKYGQTQIILDENINQNYLNEIINKYNPKYIFLKSSIIKLPKKYNIQNKNFINEYDIYKSQTTNEIKLNKNLAVLLSTSGSTGSYKFVKQSYENLHSNCKNISKYLKIKNSDCSVTNLPLNYSYGLSVINSHFIKGGSIYVTKKTILEKKFWENIYTYKITNLNGVPFFYEILKKINFEKFNLKYIKFFTQAGGALDKKLNKFFVEYCRKKQKKFIVMYGQTEATSRISYLNWKFSLSKLGSIGKAIPKGNLNIKGNKNVGELIYRGKNVCHGYSESLKDLDYKNTNKDILFTGDIAKKDQDGFYYIIGRLSRNIKIYGFRINLDDLEKKLLSKNYFCACVGKNDLIKIFYTKKSQKNSLLSFLLNNFRFKKNYFKLIFLKKLPYSTNGKIQYSKLNEIN